MTRVVYTNAPRIPLARLLSPVAILRSLLRHRDLIAAYTEREFHSAHRATYLGFAWSVISPLIMLALFVGVFGYIFGGKFNPKAAETPAEFALALFIGLTFFNCFAQSMAAAGGLVVGNSAYVKTLAFPVEILPVASVLNVLLNMGISLLICVVAHLVMYGFLHWSTLALVLHVVCIALFGLGISWFLSALSVFVRDVPAIVPPISIVLMFISGVFFPLSNISPRVRWIFELNPLAVIIDQSRSALMYGQWPNLGSLGIVFCIALVAAIGGYAFFMKTKPAFADVL